jgi:hypothetical protein
MNSDDAWVPDPSDEQVEDEDEREPLFSNPEQFVTQYLALHICRRLGGTTTWCSEWWRHTEAISRITALWSAWEHLRWEGALGLSTWWLHHADPHLARLMSKDDGPFSSCKPDRHVPDRPLPCKPAPPGMWDHSAFSG